MHVAREDESVPAYPLVQESAAQLIEASLHTKQQTLLLHKEVEVEHVDDLLRDKRAEFQRRMEACTAKRTSLQRKQQEVCRTGVGRSGVGGSSWEMD